MEDLYHKIGITAEPQQGTAFLGTAASGAPLYGVPLRPQTNTPGYALNNWLGTAKGLDSIGALTQEDTNHVVRIANAMADPSTVNQLDAHRSQEDLPAFKSTLGKAVGGTPESSKALYDAWNVLNPTQKNLGIAHASPATNDIAKKEYVPGVDNEQALKMQTQGIPMRDVKNNFAQLSAIRTAIGEEAPESNVTLIMQAARSGQLGPAQKISQSDIKFYGLTPAPQYGIGAMDMPKGRVPPQGFTVAGTTGDVQTVVPQGNEASVSYNPTLNKAAASIYNTWGEANKKAVTNNTVGGSNLYKSLTVLYDTNPKALGRAIDSQFPGEGDFNAKLQGGSVQLLTTGSLDKAKPMDDATALRALSKAGIQNKEIGYKLSNQAYAENRINDVQLFGIQRGLDNLFHGDKTLSHISPVKINKGPLPIAVDASVQASDSARL